MKSQCWYSLNNTNGFALPFILFITLLVVSMLLGLITILFFLNNIESKKIKKEKLELACTSAVQMLLSLEDSLATGEKTIQTYKYPVFVKVKEKGLFYEVTAGINTGSDSALVKCLIGYSVSFPDSSALVISLPGLRATAAGDTHIYGNITSAADKINKGKIFGIENTVDGFLDGRMIIQQNIPSKIINENIIKAQLGIIPGEEEYESKFTDGDYILNQESIKTLDLSKEINVQGNLVINGSIYSKHNAGTLRFRVTGETIFEDNIQSNIDIEIKCDSLIKIGNNVKLQNVMLSAADGIMADGSYFKNVQMFAADTIKISSSRFDYPSAICLYTDAGKVSAMKNSMIIKSSVVNGIVMLISTTTGLSQNKSIIDIDEKSIVQGFVYSENNLKIPAQVNGIVYTYNFWYYKEPTEYLNWLVNVKINRSKLSQWFLLPRGISGNSRPKILKEQWVY